MTVEGYEVIAVRSDTRPKGSRLVPVKVEKKIPQFGEHFGGDERRVDSIIEYNGLNPFEVQVAEALDGLGLSWCRNPSKIGYGIPIAQLGADVENFYPDFLLWTDKEIWAIDPKGDHIKDAAVQNKLYDVTGVDGVSTPVRVTLVLEGERNVGQDGRWISSKKDGGCTLVRRTTAGVKPQSFQDLASLSKDLRDN